MTRRMKRQQTARPRISKADAPARAEKPLAAKPAKEPIDKAQFRRDFMRQYPKTIAYLAK